MTMTKLMILAVMPLVLVLCSLGSAEETHSRARRFCCGGGGGLDMTGGRVGCVVSQNKLFINGLFIKDLDADEQQELGLYKDAQKEFKTKVQSYLEQRMNASSVDELEQLQKPEPPKKPSFCSEKATTQFVFDGCVVQGDNVYIGNNFVRKLSPEEQQELEQFDEQFTSYQEALSGQIRQRVEEAFGKSFGTLFGPMYSRSGETNSTSSQTGTGSELSEGKKTLPEMPKTPEFCTLVI